MTEVLILPLGKEESKPQTGRKEGTAGFLMATVSIQVHGNNIFVQI